MSITDIIILIQLGWLRIARVTEDRRVLEFELTARGKKMLADNPVSQFPMANHMIR